MHVIRKLQHCESPKLRAFYRENGYLSEIGPGHNCLVAEAGGVIQAALRLCWEEGCLVLRGMRVAEPFQRMGIGSELLHFAALEIGDNECYCIPYRHLDDFYAQVGFRRISSENAPDFLRMRYVIYIQQLDLDVILMRKAGLKADQARWAAL